MKKMLLTLIFATLNLSVFAGPFEDGETWINDNLPRYTESKVMNCTTHNQNVASCRVHEYTGSVVCVYDLTCTAGSGCQLKNSFCKEY